MRKAHYGRTEWRICLPRLYKACHSPKSGVVQKVVVLGSTEIDKTAPAKAFRVRIITSAHRINQGVIPDLSKPEGDSDFYLVEANDPDVAVPRIVDPVKSHTPRRFGLDPSATFRCCAR
jgi:hypothetical protein